MRERHAALWAEDERHKGRRIGTLWLDDNGNGDATLRVEFLDEPPITRADALKDILHFLTLEYDLAVKHLTTPGGS